MEKIIEIDIFEEDDLFETYNRKKVSNKLINYLVEEVQRFNKNEVLKILINTKLKVDKDYVEIIINGLKDEYRKSCDAHFKNGVIQFIYLILGILIIFFSTLIKIEVFREVVLICGWVLIWLMVELEIISDSQERRKRKKLKRIVNSEFIINRIEED